MFGLTIGSAVSGYLADPAGSNSLLAATTWLQGTLLGTVATTVAIIAVASVGLMMLAGRVNVRHGVTVIVGCFIIFGASSIVAGIEATTMNGGIGSEASFAPITQAAPPPVVAAPPLQPSGYDPYAGASVPQ